MAVAGRRRSSARSTEVTPGREPDRQSSRGRNQPCSARNSQCLTFLPTRTMTGADMRPAPRYHLAYRAGRRTPNRCVRGREPTRPLVFGCFGPIPSVLLGDCRRSSEDSPLITDHCLVTVHIVTRHAVKSPAHGHGTVRSPI